jgi:hypothetical protein
MCDPGSRTARTRGRGEAICIRLVGRGRSAVELCFGRDHCGDGRQADPVPARTLTLLRTRYRCRSPRRGLHPGRGDGSTRHSRHRAGGEADGPLCRLAHRLARRRRALATIGRRAAVVKFGRLEFTGFLGWLFWSVVHIYFLIEVRGRFIVAFTWLWNYVTSARRTTEHRDAPGGAEVTGVSWHD